MRLYHIRMVHIIIFIGEVLAVEEPYATSLDYDVFEENCLNCFSRCPAPVPCPTCSLVSSFINWCYGKTQLLGPQAFQNVFLKSSCTWEEKGYLPLKGYVKLGNERGRFQRPKIDFGVPAPQWQKFQN